jgi:hypothetical protein
MGRGALKYTAEQKEAIALAINVENRAGPEVVAAAAGGTLREGLAPFQVPVSTANEIAAVARRQQLEGDIQRLESGEPSPLATFVRRTAVLLDGELSALEQQAAGEDGELDLDRLRRVLRLMRDLQVVLNRLPGGAPETGPEDHEQMKPANTPTLAERLQATPNGSSALAAACPASGEQPRAS